MPNVKKYRFDYKKRNLVELKRFECFQLQKVKTKYGINFLVLKKIPYHKKHKRRQEQLKHRPKCYVLDTGFFI